MRLPRSEDVLGAWLLVAGEVSHLGADPAITQGLEVTVKIKPLTIVCEDESAAELLADEYYWIGRNTRVAGRCVTVLTSVVEEWADA